MLKIFDCCQQTIRELAGYRYPDGTDTKNPKDEPVKKDDHTCDALRYAVYSVTGPRPGLCVG
jgi:phage terminase large subunit